MKNCSTCPHRKVPLESTKGSVFENFQGEAMRTSALHYSGARAVKYAPVFLSLRALPCEPHTVCVRFFAGHLPRVSRKIILFIKKADGQVRDQVKKWSKNATTLIPKVAPGTRMHFYTSIHKIAHLSLQQ
jgi:hypothetical protein